MYDIPYAEEASFVDKDAKAGKSFYMVRAVKLTTSPSGSYFNGSIGQFAEATK